MRRSTLILLALNVLVWGGLAVVGYQGVQSIVQQHAPGYPSSGQIDYYVVAPLVILAVSIAWPLLLWRGRLGLRNIGPTITLLILPLYLFAYTGGM